MKTKELIHPGILQYDGERNFCSVYYFSFSGFAAIKLFQLGEKHFSLLILCDANDTSSLLFPPAFPHNLAQNICFLTGTLALSPPSKNISNSSPQFNTSAETNINKSPRELSGSWQK